MPIPVLPGSLVHLAAVKGPLTVCNMSRCRRDSFYLAPGLLRSQTGWLIQEVNNRFNANETRAAAETVASIVGLPLDPKHQYLP